jgi:hypothetical protein
MEEEFGIVTSFISEESQLFISIFMKRLQKMMGITMKKHSSMLPKI